jgi:O-methyltransferase
MRKIFRGIILFIYKCINAVSNFIALKTKSSYQLILPYATYAPWLADTAFWNTYQLVKNNSLVGHTQCYELWQLVAETHHLPGDIIEVGTWRGASLTVMAQKASLMQSTSAVYGCDTFEGVVKASQKDKYYKGGEHKDTSEKFVLNLINEKFKLENIVLKKGIFPEETGADLAAKTFRLCHIDVDTYQSAKDVLDWVWPRLQVGGIIVFNDYAFPNTNGITTLVNNERHKTDSIVVHNLNGNGLLIKVKN